MSGFDKYRESMVFTKTKIRKTELSPRQMVQEEIDAQKVLLREGGKTGSGFKGFKPRKKTSSWWDEKNDCVTITVRGTTYFSDSEKSGRIYGEDHFGKGKKWTLNSFKKFVETFQDELLKGNFVDDTKHWHQRYEKKISKSTVKRKKTVAKRRAP
ncbi:MAG: hypothetical protein HOG18_11810 [Proteobacteria bacterium]|jgi:hypothetical protein|nr:hypothetical protein [Pseudomonadota bacterium]MBT5626269.1 hypothetical protein [Pseudomonadota bacterium]MBT6070944.1 hypothetical protein [Pseudomonadota bacterium]MBT6658186.1 hypothetical protein [Pseudomonadota bacterium]MDB4826147.1 hypothetical protein [Gammaproteobacteria bacterium]